MKGKSALNIIGLLSQDVWILDSGATNHTTPFLKLFNSYVKMIREQLIIVTNGDSVPIRGSENIILESSIVLNVLYVPQMTNNFISIQKLTKNLNCSIAFSLLSYISGRYHEEEILSANEQSRLYMLESKDQHKIKVISYEVTLETWAIPNYGFIIEDLDKLGTYFRIYFRSKLVRYFY